MSIIPFIGGAAVEASGGVLTTIMAGGSSLTGSEAAGYAVGTGIGGAMLQQGGDYLLGKIQKAAQQKLVEGRDYVLDVSRRGRGKLYDRLETYNKSYPSTDKRSYMRQQRQSKLENWVAKKSTRKFFQESRQIPRGGFYLTMLRKKKRTNRKRFY